MSGFDLRKACDDCKDNSAHIKNEFGDCLICGCECHSANAVMQDKELEK